MFSISLLHSRLRLFLLTIGRRLFAKMLVVSLSFAFPTNRHFFRRYASIFAEEVVAEGRRVGVDDLLGVFEELQFGGAGEFGFRVDPRFHAQEIGRQTSEGG